jgi:NADH dehydrogenase
MTGIELAASLAERYRQRVEVSLVGRINLPDALAVSYTRGILKNLGVQLFEDARVQTLEPNGLTLTAAESPMSLEADVVVATMGDEGAASSLNANDVENQVKRLAVEPTLQLADHPEVFVAGDAATHRNPTTGDEVRQTAAMAELAGRHAAQNVRRLFAGEDLAQFSGDLKMWVASLGEHDAVGSVLGVPVRGWVASTIKGAITRLSEHPSRLGYEIVNMADVIG